MYNEGAPEFVVDQGLYYPAATNYGYYCTGFEPAGEWENHQMIFGIDGPDVQYAGGQIENSPYLCYGYAQSPYNPYNPYIPGAIIGADGSFVGSQQYYPVPTYQTAVSSPACIPVVVQPDIGQNSSSVPLLEDGAPIAGRSDGKGSKYELAPATSILSRNSDSNCNGYSSSRNSERLKNNTSQSKQSGMNASVSSASFSTSVSNRAFQGRTTSVSAQPIDNISTGRLMSRGPFEAAPSLSNSFPESDSYLSVHKVRPKIYGGRGVNDLSASVEAIGEQNRGPRTKRSKNKLVVKAYTTKSRDADAQGNIVINPDEYNKDDFKVDYDDAKFFVIKSYSEDDVHKSIKYNVWSSTPHGNKKLQSAYEHAQQIASEKTSGCPIFLFFSVNASGLFCGVAEMVGPVDFHKDMDFWQQDKWSGSFPVKWHIIKDVPNRYFRHIILGNNENKPVTNSRDTQEMMQKQGLEMLKIFKDHMAKTSLLDDFMYYEDRQRIMHEEKARLLYNRTFQSPFLIPESDSTNKLNFLVRPPSNKDEKITKDDSKNPLTSVENEVHINSNVRDTSTITKEKVAEIGDKAKADNASTLNIGSLTINQSEAKRKLVIGASVLYNNQNAANFEPTIGVSVLNNNQKKAESKPPVTSSSVAKASNEAKSGPVTVSSDCDIVTVGSMPIKVHGLVGSSSRTLTVGTIPLDPRSLKQ